MAYAPEVNCADCGVAHVSSVPQAPDPVHAAVLAQPAPVMSVAGAGDTDGVPEFVGDVDGVAELVCVSEVVPVFDCVGDTLGVLETLVVVLGVGLTLALAPVVSEGVGLTVLEGDTVGLTVLEGVGEHEKSAAEPAGQAAGQPHALHAEAEPKLYVPTSHCVGASEPRGQHDPAGHAVVVDESAGQ